MLKLIIEQIHDCFPRDAPPKIVTSYQKEADPEGDKNLYGTDEGYAIQGFQDRGWWEIAPAYVNESNFFYTYKIGFCFLTEEAFRYYLPTLMLLAADDIAHDQVHPGEWAIAFGWRVDPKAMEQQQKYFEDVFGQLTKTQKQCVAKMVAFIKATFPDERLPVITSSCEAYWSQFL